MSASANQLHAESSLDIRGLIVCMKFIPLSHPMEVRYTVVGGIQELVLEPDVRIIKLIMHRTREETKDVESNNKGGM